MAFQGRAADNVALASAAAVNEADSRGLELLRNEFNNLQAWSESYMRARNSRNAAALSTSPNALNDDAEAQQLVHSGQFRAQMFASGSVKDNLACR